MKKVLGAALVAALLIPAAGFAAEATGKVKAWDAAKKMVTLENNTACTLGANVAAPAGIAVGKDVTLTYDAAAAGNTCSKVVVK